MKQRIEIPEFTYQVEDEIVRVCYGRLVVAVWQPRYGIMIPQPSYRSKEPELAIECAKRWVKAQEEQSE